MRQLCSKAFAKIVSIEEFLSLHKYPIAGLRLKILTSGQNMYLRGEIGILSETLMLY